MTACSALLPDYSSTADMPIIFTFPFIFTKPKLCSGLQHPISTITVAQLPVVILTDLSTKMLIALNLLITPTRRHAQLTTNYKEKHYCMKTERLC